jgi:hypothetical protein
VQGALCVAPAAGGLVQCKRIAPYLLQLAGKVAVSENNILRCSVFVAMGYASLTHPTLAEGLEDADLDGAVGEGGVG